MGRSKYAVKKKSRRCRSQKRRYLCCEKQRIREPLPSQIEKAEDIGVSHINDEAIPPTTFLPERGSSLLDSSTFNDSSLSLSDGADSIENPFASDYETDIPIPISRDNISLKSSSKQEKDPLEVRFLLWRKLSAQMNAVINKSF